MGTMGSPSTESIDGLDFLAKMPHSTPPERTDHRAWRPAQRQRNGGSSQTLSSTHFPLNTLAKHVSASAGRIKDGCATHNLNQRIAGDPFERHAGPGRSFAGRKIRSVDFVQRVVLRFMGVAPCLARRHGNAVSQRETEKDLEVDDAI